MGTGETVLVTAAAGGTGQFAVQLAKLAGNTVIATCGGPEKAALLRDLGVDRVIDYRQEDVGQVSQCRPAACWAAFARAALLTGVR
jgi:NADPH-dependent curcumin reductase CurA